MNENVKIFFWSSSVVLPCFYMVMIQLMSDALQKAAGEGMKKILSFLTEMQ